jgi:cardiolipin synthase A/B
MLEILSLIDMRKIQILLVLWFVFRMVLAALLAGTLTACTVLPDFKTIMAKEYPDLAEPAVIRNSEEVLSPRESMEILQNLEKQVSAANILEKQIKLVQLVTRKPLSIGNKVTLLVDRQVSYAAMFKAIEDARDHINLETFLFEDKAVGRRIADLLIRKRSEGVEVNVIYDNAGSWETPPELFQSMRNGGIQLVVYNPINPLKVRTDWAPFSRDHRKILIVDGAIAFTGSINVAGKDTRGLAEAMEEAADDLDSVDIPAWRDTDVKIEGPAVADLQQLFMETWARQGGPILHHKLYFPHLEEKGNDLVQIIGSTAGYRNRRTYLMYLSAIHFSQRSIYLTDAYFAPDERIVEELCAAAGRGVDVRIIVPRVTDHREILEAGRFYFSRLMESGVKLYERREALLHAKTAVVDGIWSTVGSTNLDMWSLARDDEINAVVVGPGFAEYMTAMLQMDRNESHRIRKAEWEKRPVGSRLKEWFAHQFSFWL